MDTKARFDGLSKGAYLDVLLPKAPDFDAAALLRDGSPEGIAQVPARRNLFFDEQANILVILKASIAEDDVRQIIPDLELVVAAHATDAVPQGSGNAASASGKHDLASKTFPAGIFVDVVPLGDKTYVVWKPVLHLSRSRARLQRPAIYFTVNLTIKSNSTNRKPQDQRYLKSFEPLPANVLEPLQFDPAFAGANVFLPESRITKVAPKATNLHDTVKPIRGASKRAFPAVPALFSKIRFSALPDAMVASIHLETSPIIAGVVTIDQIQLDGEGAHVQPLNTVHLPLKTKCGDETIALYRLKADDKANRTIQGDGTNVSISILANASLDQGSRITLDIKWQTQVDLSQTTPQPLYRWSRPLSTVSGHHRGLSTQSNPSLVSFDVPQRQTEIENGITLNFTASATTRKGSTFKLDVLCNNRSSRPRRFALMMLQPRKPRATTQSQTANTNADLVANMFNAPPLERIKSPDVLDLSPDVRIGPLPPGACFETHMKFQALKTGVLDLGVLRILDLDTRQMVDVRELPDIVALDPSENE